jgi:Flp pilus assembly protein TadG
VIRRLPGSTRLRRALGAFRRDRRGVSAVEFALIAPMIIAGYFGMSELSSAMMVQRRTSHAASALGDLTTQYQTLTLSNVTDIFAAASIVMQPFSTTPLQLRLTSVTLQSNGKATVDWSQVSSGSTLTAYTKTSTMTGLPTGLLVNTGDNIVMSESRYAYTSPVTYMLPSGFNFSDTFYLSPRYGSTIACTGC